MSHRIRSVPRAQAARFSRCDSCHHHHASQAETASTSPPRASVQTPVSPHLELLHRFEPLHRFTVSSLPAPQRLAVAAGAGLALPPVPGRPAAGPVMPLVPGAPRGEPVVPAGSVPAAPSTGS